MTKVQIREATLQDAMKALRRSEFIGKDRALSAHMAMSDRTYVGLANDEIVCVWGVMRQTLLSDRGYMWLITTEAAEAHKFLIVRYSQRLVEALLENYTLLAGECRVTDTRAIRWMKLLGAKFGSPEGNAVPFYIERRQ